MSLQLGKPIPYILAASENKNTVNPIGNLPDFGSVTGVSIGFWLYVETFSVEQELLSLEPATSQVKVYKKATGLRLTLQGNDWSIPDLLQVGSWHWIVIEYGFIDDPFFPTIQIYINDNKRFYKSFFYYPPSIGPFCDLTVAGIQFAPSYSDKIRDCAIWAVQVFKPYGKDVAAWMRPNDSGLMGYFCLSEVPMVDKSGKGGSIALQDGAIQICTTPGLDLSWGGYAEPKENIDVFGSEFTFQAWVYPEVKTHNGTILSSGQAGISPVFMRFQMNSQVDGNQNPTGFNLGFRQQLPTGHPDEFATDFSIQPNTWVNIAVVRQENSVKLYIDGSLKKDGQVTSPLGSLAPTLIGATIDIERGSFTNVFGGLIQNIAAWKTPLTEDQIKTYMEKDPSSEADCLAYYHFASLPVVNDVTLEPIALVGAAEVYDRSFPTLQDQSASDSRTECLTEDPSDVQVIPLNERSIVYIADPRPDNDEYLIDILLKEYDSALHQCDWSEQRAELLANHEKKLRDLIEESHDQGWFPLNSVKHAIEGDRIVFYLRAPEGIRPVYDIPYLDGDNSCLAFKIDFVATLFFGILGILGAPTSLANISKFKTLLNRALKNQLVLAAITTALDGEITFRGICVVLKALWDESLLTDALKSAVTLSRWDMFFFAITTTFTLLELIVPNPSSAIVYALYVAKSAQLLITLGVSWAGRPKGCLPLKVKRQRLLGTIEATQ